MSRCCLRDWLRSVPDPRKKAGRWHRLEFVPALAVCAFTAAGHDSPAAIAEWSRGCTQDTLALLDGRPDPLAGRVHPPSERTFRRILQKISAAAFDRALRSFLDTVQEEAPQELPEVIRREREQRRAAAEAKKPGIPGLLPQAACDGKAVRGAVRPDGSRVHLMSAFHVGQKRTPAQHEVDSKSNEIPELIPVLQEFNISGTVITVDALRGQRDAAEKIHAMGGYYLQFIKGNQPSLRESIAVRLTGTDAEFADESWTEEGKGHGRRIIEQLLADLNDGPLAHLPSGKFNANAAWLAIAAIAHNLLRAAGSLAGRRHARARAATVRRDLIAVAARTARRGRDHITLHLPEAWHREREWRNLFEAACGPPATAA
jgi:predicted transposase YbfD/YdcC